MGACIRVTAHDPASPCAQPDDLGGLCGGTPTHPYMTGVACRFHAPGATEDHCQHGVGWTDDCGRCAGEPPAPSPYPSPSDTRTPPTYGLRTDDPLHRTITRNDSGGRFDDRIPRYACPGCVRPRAKGHKGDHITT
jgi:hypothetical protein